jgi:hypothetical protein
VAKAAGVLSAAKVGCKGERNTFINSFNKIRASLYFAAVFKMVKTMLMTMHVIEKNRSDHSEIISFMIKSSSISVWTIQNSKGLFYQISAKHRNLHDSAVFLYYNL